MENLFLIGRILFGGFFLMNGMRHFIKSKDLAMYAKSKGVPIPLFSVVLSGFFIFFGGFGVLLGVYVQAALTLIATFLFLVSFMMHNFWTIPDPQIKMVETVNFMKNVALAGAALMMLSLPIPWMYSIMLLF